MDELKQITQTIQKGFIDSVLMFLSEHTLLVVLFISALSFIALYELFILPIVRGKAGERIVSGIVSALPEKHDKSEYTELRDIMLRSQTGTTQIDHIVMSKYGIFVIETKHYSGCISGSQYAAQWTQTFGKNHKQSFYNPIRQNYGHIKALCEVLSLPESAFISIVVFTDDSAVLKVNAKTPVTTADKLNSTIRSYTEVILSSQELAQARAILSSSNITDREKRALHRKEIREKKNAAQASSQANICPRCGKELVERTGKYGAFLGCKGYPSCQYTKSTNCK